jgi:hypothetical protein
MFGDLMEVQKEGYAVDKKYPFIHYVPENARFNLMQQSITPGKKAVRREN